MNNKIEWFNNGKKEPLLEYIGILNGEIVCRIKREDSAIWVSRNKNGEYIDKHQYRHDLFDFMEVKFSSRL